jgi:hypothetical protein
MTKSTVTLAALGLAVAAIVTTRAQQRSPISGALTPQDYYEIQQLYARYCHALDSEAGHGAMFASVFTPNGVLVDRDGNTYQGQQQLTTFARQNPDTSKGPINTGHFSTNILIEPSAAGARGKSYLMIAEGEVGRRQFVNGGQYWDEFAKTPDGWRFSKRVFHGARENESATAGPQWLSAPPAMTESAPEGTTQGGLTAQDYAEIQQLYARYTYAFDGGVGNGKDWADLFTEDGFHVNPAQGEYVKGSQSLAEFSRGAMTFNNGFVLMRSLTGTTKNPMLIGHILANIMLEPTTEGVVSKLYRITATMGTGGRANTLRPGGIYYDLLVKTAGGWRYKEKWYLRDNVPIPEAARRFITPNGSAQATGPTASR